MPSRMDKYKEESKVEPTITRSQKNEQLYKDIYTNRRYTEIGNLEKDNIVDITSALNRRNSSRSEFQQKRILYEDGFINDEIPVKEEIIEEDDEKVKSYNINEILEEARKNRNIDSEQEKQRKIKSAEYSILSDLSQEKLKEYQERKERPLSKNDEENLEDLIHTITSNSLRKKIDDGLLTDLMPETDEEPVISQEFLQSLDIEDVKKDEDTKELTLDTTIDRSFYTRSMDLKKEDILPSLDDEEIDEETDESFEDDMKLPAWKLVLIILSVALVLGVLTYVLIRFI